MNKVEILAKAFWDCPSITQSVAFDNLPEKEKQWLRNRAKHALNQLKLTYSQDTMTQSIGENALQE